jgi:uncharacterized membrane protein
VARYNAIAGERLGRIEALSDGVFAIAMTLLVLDLKVPGEAAVQAAGGLANALMALAPRLLTYLMSFLTLGIFWVGQNTQHGLLARGDRGLAWLNIVFLMVVSLVPFTTALLAEHLEDRAALLIYWLNIFLMGGALLATWYRARWFDLVKPDAADAHAPIVRRILIAQALYAVGAALCIFSTWWSIAFIVAVQLQYAIAPRFWPFNRL